MQQNQDVGPRIVVGFDGSSDSTLALRWAVQLGALAGARVDAIRAWQFPVDLAQSYGLSDWDPEVDPAREFQAALTESFGEDNPPDLQLTVRNGDPAEVLIEESRSATMLVVGNRGRGGFVTLLMGSVSNKCAHHSACPVLVVRGGQEPHLPGPGRPVTPGRAVPSTG